MRVGSPVMPEIIKEWGGMAALFISIGGTVYAWLTRSSKENAKTIEKMGEEMGARFRGVEKKLIGDDRRIQYLEDNFEHLPSKEQVTELRVALAQVGTTVENTNRMVERLDEDLRSLKKG